MERLKIGVVGTGIMGELYIRALQADPRAEAAAICNRGAERREAAAERYGIAARYGDAGEMVAAERLDAVCVATPDFAHYEPVKAALEAGCHVLCEKPFTTDVDEADELCRLADARGLTIQVAYSHRWLAPYHRTHAAIQAGEIGEPLMGYARKNDTLWVAEGMIDWAHKTTPSMFLSGHDIDLMRWYFGSEPVEAHGYGSKSVLAAKGIDTYDIMQAQVRFANGAYATFEAGWIYADTYPTIPDSFVQVVGTKGHISHDRAVESMVMTTEAKFSYPKTFLVNEVFGKLGGAFPACVSAFVDCVATGSKPIVSAWDGRQVTAALCAIDEAVRTGRTVAVR